MKLITTSWDDGHEADFRLADLLHKYNLKGTFYIPKNNAERPVMSEAQIVDLSKAFEIGGHTLNHVRLHKADDETRKKEIGGSFGWLTELIGKPPVSFCFPGGAYTKKLIEQAYSHGYKVLRTTELHSTTSSLPYKLMRTTVQAYEHNRLTHAKHLLKRMRFQNLFRWMQASSITDINKLAEFYLKQIETHGGCFHLWGHSWEIDKMALWPKLENIFENISNRSGFSYVENYCAVQQ